MNQDILLLNQKSAHTIGFFDVDKGVAIKQIEVDKFPHEFVVDSKREFAYVGHYGVQNSGVTEDHGGCSIFVIDLKTQEHVHTISTWPYYRIHGLALDDKDRLYAMSESQNVMVIFEFPRTANAPDRALPSGGLKTHLFSLTRDGSTAYCLNLLSHTVTKIKPWDPVFNPIAMYPGKKPEGNCLSSDEKTLYVTNRLDDQVVAIDTESLAVTARADTGADPTRAYLSPDDMLYVTNYGGQSITIFNLSLENKGTIALPADPIAVSFHPTNGDVFVSLTNDTVAVLDATNLNVKRSFSCLAEPDVSMLLQSSSSQNGV